MNPAATAAPRRSLAEAADPPEIKPMHWDYFSCVLPDPPVVCGRQLLPLSIGRYRLMHRFRVAFVADESATATARDLFIGVLICSLRCEEFQSFAASPRFKGEIARWGRRCGFFRPWRYRLPLLGPWLAKRYGHIIDRHHAANLLAEIEKFQAYIAEGAQPPRYWDAADGQRTSAAHWSHSIESTLREYQGWTREEINEEPLTKALWDYFKHCENHGLVRLMTADEAAALDTPDDPEKLAELTAWARLVELAQAGRLNLDGTERVPAT